MKPLKWSVWVMALMSFLLVIGSVGTAFWNFGHFYSSVFILLPTAVLAVLIIWSIVTYPFRLKKIGFFIGHAGIIVVIVSAVVSMIGKTETYFSIPVNKNLYYGSVAREDGTDIEFGFDISIADFEVVKYDPDYRLYKTDPRSANGYSIVEETVIMDRKGVYHIGKYGDISRDKLEINGRFIDQMELGEGLILVKLPEADKAYNAEMQIREYDTDEVKSCRLSVNHPYKYRGWKFYLMDYDHTTGSSVQLYAKKDPGNISFGIGLFMSVAGTFIMCFGKLSRKTGKKGKESETCIR